MCNNNRSEVTDINKQKFLAELGKLLTFMYEEDRQQALNMYDAMFESARDERDLMQVLVSPTRQAVVIARAYDAKESSLQVHSLSREEDGLEDEAELPGFVLAIDEVYQAAARQGVMDSEDPISTVLDDQLSLFEDDAWPIESENEPEAVEPELEEAAAAEIAEEPVEAEESPVETEPADEVDAFLASFSIVEEELVPAAAEEVSEPAEETAEPEEEAAEAEEAPVVEAEPMEEEAQTEIAAVTEEPASVPVHTATVRKPRVFLLILYIIAAIPVTLAGLALLLVPTVIVGALAASVIMTGSASFVAAFSGFAVFADMLVVLGSALVVSAVGLILLWLFIWFIGDAMVGLIRSVVELGGKCCYKEVPVNG